MLKMFGDIMKSKKGVSGLVVVILLVAFVVAVGAGIIGWMQSYINQGKESVNSLAYEEVFCGTDVDFNIWYRDNTPMICLNSTAKLIKVYLENRGRYVEKWLVRISAVNGTDTMYVKIPFDKGDVKTIYINYSTVPNFVSLQIFPIILDNKQAYRMCKNKYLEISKSKIPDCAYVAPFYY